jgi:oxalate decarboxylase
MAGHYIENTGDADLVFLETFKSPVYEDYSLNNWLRRLPPEAAMAHLKIGQTILNKIPAEKYVVLPK